MILNKKERVFCAAVIVVLVMLRLSLFNGINVDMICSYISVGFKLPQIPSNITQESSSRQSAVNEMSSKPPWKSLRIAVYMTTHQSEQHLEFLKKCWPYATSHLPLLQHADLIYYYAASTVKEEPPITILKQFQFHNITVWQYENPGYQAGAKQAMVDPFDHGWFDGYDWIVRLNPDVLIRNDTWFLEQMVNASVDALFYQYHNPSSSSKSGIFTDFSAFRPQAANVTALKTSLQTTVNAESHMRNGFSHVIQAGRVGWIPHGKQVRKAARIVGKKSFVIHKHSLLQHCPNYFNASGKNF
jgi:hypothetical protein